MKRQLDLGQGPALPAGFRYRPDWLPTDEEGELVQHVAELPFRAFKFQGYTGKRRIVSFGWQYDFVEMKIRRAEDIPPFLLPVRDRAAGLAGVAPSELQHVLLTGYAPGAPIGWHKDKAVFEKVVGISLLSPCVFRLRRKKGERWERASVTLGPRSAYLLDRPSRTKREHSIPGAESLRYSITFRNLRQ